MNDRPPIVPPFRRLVHQLQDPEEFAHAVSGGSLAADFLAPREAATHVEQFQASGWALDFHDAKVKARIRCGLPPGWGSIGCMRSPVPSRWYGREAGRGALVRTPPGESIDGLITPGFTCLSITVPGALWEEARELSGCRQPDFGGAGIQLMDEPAFAAIERRILDLRRLLRVAAQEPAWAAAAETEALGLAVDVLCETWIPRSQEAEPRSSPRNRARLARRAEDWMRAHLGEPVLIPELCRALRVSRRELEYAFRQAHDESPRDFLHSLRLNAIRRELLRGGRTGSVSGIALAHGITHFGRFSAAYRRLFGENPGQSRPEAAPHRRSRGTRIDACSGSLQPPAHVERSTGGHHHGK